jgi:hypothetical protein
MMLYKVHLTYETVIRAESREAAEKEAEYAMRHEIDDEPLSVDASEINDVNDLPHGWNPQCRPWGERDPYDRTIGQILSANVPSEVPRKAGGRGALAARVPACRGYLD